MKEYFPESKSLGGKLKVKLGLSNYAAKADLKTATGVDTSVAKKTDLANSKCRQIRYWSTKKRSS